MQGGSADEAAYPHDFEVGCAVCSVPESQGSVYPRWGHRECPAGVTTLYSGFMSSSHYGHRGGGANTLCMHPQGQVPAGAHPGDQNGNLLYGMEYQSTHDGLEQLTTDGCPLCDSRLTYACPLCRYGVGRNGQKPRRRRRVRHVPAARPVVFVCELPRGGATAGH